MSGDKSAFTELIVSCESTMYGTAMNLLKNHEDACDCIQDAILEAYKNLASLREAKFFKTWLIRILINKCYKTLKLRGEGTDELSENCSQAPQADIDTAADVQNTLSSLNEKDRIILSLFYIEDISVKDIATILSISEGAVKLRLKRGRDHFKAAYSMKGESRDEYRA